MLLFCERKIVRRPLTHAELSPYRTMEPGGFRHEAASDRTGDSSGSDRCPLGTTSYDGVHTCTYD
jgi:hypothetical protein